MNRILPCLLVLLIVLLPTLTHAHEFRPAVLSLEERSDGAFHVQWRPPFDGQRNEILELDLHFPDGCSIEGPRLDGAMLRCGPGGLHGALAIDGLDRRPVDVVVRVAWKSGARNTFVLDATSPTVELARPGDRGLLQEGATYLVLGVEHILGGIDHVFFVIGLVVIVGFNHRLLLTITGFTIAHSITLACSVLGLVTPPQGPVEAVIALSILLLAVELARGERGSSLTRRVPSVVAFVFGLLHGFGFAGALLEIGLPNDQIPLSLAAFNVGVELGQIAVVGLLFLVALGLRRLNESAQSRLLWALAYGLGIVSAWWTIERSVALFVT